MPRKPNTNYRILRQAKKTLCRLKAMHEYIEQHNKHVEACIAHWKIGCHYLLIGTRDIKMIYSQILTSKSSNEKIITSTSRYNTIWCLLPQKVNLVKNFCLKRSAVQSSDIWWSIERWVSNEKKEREFCQRKRNEQSGRSWKRQSVVCVA